MTALCSRQTLTHEFCTINTLVLLNWQFSPFGSRIPRKNMVRVMNSFHQRPENVQINTFPMQFRGFKNSHTPSPPMQIHRPQGKNSCSTSAWAIWKTEMSNQHLPGQVLKRVILMLQTLTHLLKDAWQILSFTELFWIPSNCEGFHSLIL